MTRRPLAERSYPFQTSVEQEATAFIAAGTPTLLDNGLWGIPNNDIQIGSTGSFTVEGTWRIDKTNDADIFTRGDFADFDGTGMIAGTNFRVVKNSAAGEETVDVEINPDIGGGGVSVPEVIQSGAALTGAAPGGAKFGVDTSTGQTYYVDGAGNWQEATGQPEYILNVGPLVGAAPTGAKRGLDTANNVFYNVVGGVWVEDDTADFVEITPPDPTNTAQIVTATRVIQQGDVYAKIVGGGTSENPQYIYYVDEDDTVTTVKTPGSTGSYTEVADEAARLANTDDVRIKQTDNGVVYDRFGATWVANDINTRVDVNPPVAVAEDWQINTIADGSTWRYHPTDNVWEEYAPDS